MTRLRRYHQPGQWVFVTLVTRHRAPILVADADLLFRSLCRTRRAVAFELIGWVVLPDHLHAVIVPRAPLSVIIQRFKLSFSRQWRERHGIPGPVWQEGYWDHVIRDEKDLSTRLSYIRCNPVKHRCVDRFEDWPFSSFRRRVTTRRV